MKHLLMVVLYLLCLLLTAAPFSYSANEGFGTMGSANYQIVYGGTGTVGGKVTGTNNDIVRSNMYPFKIQNGINGSIDMVPPVITITYPQDQDLTTNIGTLEVTADDPSPSSTISGSGVYKVEIQVFGNNKYLMYNSQGGYYTLSYSTTPVWIEMAERKPNSTNGWYLNTDLTPWEISIPYTIQLRVTDNHGNQTLVSSSFARVSPPSIKYTSTLTIEPGYQAILANGSLTISGQLNWTTTGTAYNFANRALAVTVTDSAGKPVAFKDSTGATFTAITGTTTDAAGHYRFENLHGFTSEGMFNVNVAFAENDILQSSSATSKLFVGSQAGYAVLIQGSIPNDPAGLLSHTKTTDRIYTTLKEKGFASENIFYYNRQSATPGAPTITGLNTLFNTTLPPLLNGSPAPLYVIMVDHGHTDGFKIGAETITPDILKGWLAGLENKLNGDALKKRRIVIVGSCYSGVFMKDSATRPIAMAPTASNGGRVIISSAAADEVSFRGPAENDSIRSGEYFIDAFFRELREQGSNLTSAFRKAADLTRTYTRAGGTAPPVNGYGDIAVQHPLMDDNGDGTGSSLVSDVSGDGAVAVNQVMGVSQNLTNAAGDAEITAVAPETPVSQAGQSADLWLKVIGDPTASVASAWVEIRAPGQGLYVPSGVATMQQDTTYTRVQLLPPSDSANPFKAQNDRWAVKYYGIGTPGTYELFYFTREAGTGKLSRMKRGVVYKNQTGNTAPGAFILTAPADGSSVQTTDPVFFTWDAAADPDGVTYTLLITKSDGITEVLRKEGLTANYALITPEEFAAATLWTDKSEYLWKVTAYDSYGRFTGSGNQFYISTNNTNALPSFIYGTVRNAATGLPVTAATVRLNGGAPVSVRADGVYFMTALSGLSLAIDAPGYQGYSVNSLSLSPGKVTNNSVFLTPIAAPSRPGDCDADNTVTIAEVQSAINMFLGLKTVAACVDTDGAGGVSIAEVQKAINSFLGL